MGTPDINLVHTMRDAAQGLIDMRSIRDRDTLLSQLIVSAVGLVPAATGGGLSRTNNREIQTSHATTHAVYELDQLQNRLEEGPCISAALDPPADGCLLARDLQGSDAHRWPRFAPYAVEAGVHSMLSTSVVSERGGVRSALNLYSGQRDAFDATAVVTAGLFATQVGALLYGADHAAHLGIAVASRDVIGQGKGVLMERFTLDPDEAFEMLVQSSQQTNMKLVDVAQWLVDEAIERRAATRKS
ncbi:ANTAR domain-containing protein [Actinomycetospora aeridis]|uniref:ANTAR domain-containing protein n=1 Tax=Actinomycetospora aeridis TaxID=3129231 RepID=A0ABU8NFZ5_9PSEU